MTGARKPDVVGDLITKDTSKSGEVTRFSNDVMIGFKNRDGSINLLSDVYWPGQVVRLVTPEQREKEWGRAKAEREAKKTRATVDKIADAPARKVEDTGSIMGGGH